VRQKERKTTINLCSSHTPYGIGASHGVPVPPLMLLPTATWCGCPQCPDSATFVQIKKILREKGDVKKK